MKRSFIHDNSGQVLIITGLLVALIMLSTALYVIEGEKNTPIVVLRDDDISAYKLNARNAVIASLANVTNGGDVEVLGANLNVLASALTAHSYQAMLKIEATPLTATPYINGVWLFWGDNGQGVSSAYATFSFERKEVTATSRLDYAVNVTSTVMVAGVYTRLEDNFAQVNLTVSLANEGKPAIAQDLAVYYELDGSLVTEEWILVASPEISTIGNGLYTLSFVAQTQGPNDPVLASVRCIDQRGITIKANIACTSLG